MSATVSPERMHTVHTEICDADGKVSESCDVRHVQAHGVCVEAALGVVEHVEVKVADLLLVQLLLKLEGRKTEPEMSM